MAHTFDIRFARAAGLAGLFDSPRNSFGWRGGGLLSIDARGVSVKLKRGLMSLLARHRSQRIPAESIREVYREGDALRVEFTTGNNARHSLPFWAPDRATAEKIIQLLPTTRTFEVEHVDQLQEPKKSRNTGWMLAAGLVLVGAAMFAILDRSPVVELQAPEVAVQVPETSAKTEASDAPPRDDLAEIPVAVAGVPLTPEQARRKALFYDTPDEPAGSASPQTDADSQVEAFSALPPGAASPRAASPDTASPGVAARPIEAETETEGFVPSAIPEIRVRPAEGAIPIPQGTLASDAGRGLLARFEENAVNLRKEHILNRQQFESRDLSRRGFVRHLISFQERWREIGVSLRDDREWQDPALSGLRTSLLAVANYQMRFYDGYASGLAGGNQGVIDQAFSDQQRADEFLEAARVYVR